MTSKIDENLKQLYNAGINPDVTNITIKVDSKNLFVQWSATLDESRDGKAYMGVTTRGSAGGGADKRAQGQVQQLMTNIEKKGGRNVKMVLDFVNKSGIYIRQFFYAYTLPEKYPPHPSGSGKYTRTADPIIVQTGSVSGTTDNKSTNTSSTPTQTSNQSSSQSPMNAFSFDFKNMFSGLKDVFKNQTQQPTQDGGDQTQPTTGTTTPTDTTTSGTINVVSGGGGSANFKEITQKVIANFEGGYWNPICHGRKGMGKSTETMFGLDRYNGNIESTDKGKQFFKIIDDEKRALGAKSTGEGKNMSWTNMDGFCKKWTYNYKGDSKTKQPLMDLATSIMEDRFNSYMSSFVKDPKIKEKIMNNKNLLTHMSYATWNGIGFFKKFAQKLESSIKQGLKDKELVDVAIQSRAQTGLYNKDKVAKAIANPDSMKPA